MPLSRDWAFVFFAPLFAASLAAAESEPMLWIEGESAKTTNVIRHPWWYEKVKTEDLAGGAMLAHWGDKPGDARYEFECPEERTYAFWLRANPVQAKLSYQFDGGAWSSVEFGKDTEQQTNIAADDKPDLRFLAWVKAGTVKLAKGTHTLQVKFESANNHHGMLDCFVLHAGAFKPNGPARPGEKHKLAEETGRWAFNPEKDEFSSDALLDLRGLNEKVAGESGFVTRSKDGSELLLGNGQPARFWAVNSGVSGNPKLDLERHARFLAKRGINMVRLHCDISPGGNNLMAINEADRENLWRAVAAYKKSGIYVVYSPFWAGHAKINPAMGFLNDGGNQNWGLLFFDKKLQAGYKHWLKEILTVKNPHTGVPLAQDPALAIFQIQNEDSLFFYTAQNIKGEAKQELRRQFGAFLTRKYGALDKAKEAWNGAVIPADQDAPDDFAKGEAALCIVWELTQRRNGPDYQKRVSDQMQFLAETMRNFNQEIGAYLKNELGAKQLVNAGNWRTADNVTMLDAERWSYGANEVMAVNRYYGGDHNGQHNGWAIVNGDTFTDESALLNPRALPVTLKQPEGFPIMITESSWVPPQGYQSEGPFLISAYQSLTGVDGYFWFATGEVDWRHPGSANGFLPSEGKWVCATPMLLGQWPAAALLFRRGYVKQGEPTVREERRLEDLWQRSMPIIAEDSGYDPNRDKDSISKESNVKNGVNPLAYLAGPVVVKYGGKPAKSSVADLARLLDAEKKVVRSNTGELELDYGRGLCLLTAPKAQGVTGFLKQAGSFKLPDVEIVSGNAYATVLVVSMDDKDLKQSGRVLVQVGTTERPTGWKTEPAKIGKKDGERIVSFGKAPWQIVKADVKVTIKNPALKTAVVLDANGMASAELPLAEANGGKQFTFPVDALYVILK